MSWGRIETGSKMREGNKFGNKRFLCSSHGYIKYFCSETVIHRNSYLSLKKHYVDSTLSVHVYVCVYEREEERRKGRGKWGWGYKRDVFSSLFSVQ